MAAMLPFFNDPSKWVPLPEYQLSPTGQPLKSPEFPLGVGPLGTPLRNGPGGMPLNPQAQMPGSGQMHNQQFGPAIPTSFAGGGDSGPSAGATGSVTPTPGGGPGQGGLPFNLGNISGRDVLGMAINFLPAPFNLLGNVINKATTQPAAAPNPFSFDVGGSTLSLPSGSPMAGYGGATYGGQAVSPAVAEALAGGDMANAMAQASNMGTAGPTAAPDWNFGSGMPGDFAFSDPSMGGYDFGFSGGPGY